MSAHKDASSSCSSKFTQEEHLYRKHITLGIEEKLQKNRMIRDINIILRSPIEKIAISGWERKNRVSLLEDLKNFYQSTNGLKITWNLEHAGDVLKIGEINVNEISQLLPMDSLEHAEASSRTIKGNNANTKLKSSASEIGKLSRVSSGENEEVNKYLMYFSELRLTMEANRQIPTSQQQDNVGLFLCKNDKAFLLDQNKYGWAALIYSDELNKIANFSNSPRPVSEPPQSSEPYVEIWFLDNSLQWHYLAPTFFHYYRMQLYHLGLPQWQYRFTPYGLSSWAEQIFWLVAPHLLTPEKIADPDEKDDSLWSRDLPPEASTPNPVPNVLTSHIFRRKKKDKKEAT